MIQRGIQFIVFTLLVFSHSVLLSQNQDEKTGGAVLQARFVKAEFEQEAGALGFNVVHIYNPTAFPVKIKPELVVPVGWAVFSTAMNETTVPPNDSIFLPFRLRIPTQADSDKQHEIILNVFSETNTLLLRVKSYVKPVSFHNWRLVIPERRVYFYPRIKLAEFNVIIENNGNTHELIRLDVQPDFKVRIGSASDWETGQTYQLGPQQDTTLHFRVYYTSQQERIFDISKIQIIALTDESQDSKVVLIEKYIDTYDPFQLNYYLPHMIEAGFRMSNTRYEMTPFLNARGKHTFSRSSDFEYLFSNYNMSETNHFINNSTYRFIYHRKSLKAGLGSIGSTLGRNIYSQNAIMLSNVFTLNKYNTIELFGSQDFMDPISSIAAGYNYVKGKLDLQGSIGYNLNRLREVNTGSLLFRTSPIKIWWGHSVNAILYAIREDHYHSKPYAQQGVAWDINYFGRIGKKFTFQLINNYGSPDIPGSRMGLLKLAGNLKFMPFVKNNFFSSKYINISRTFYNYNYEGVKMRSFTLHDQYINLLFHSYKNKNNRWSVGPSVELYRSLTPLYSGVRETADYKVQKFKLEFFDELWHDLKLDIKAGIRNISYKGDIEVEEMKYDLNFVADYSRNGYGVRLRYDYGPMINSGLYQASSDVDYNGIQLSPYISKYYWKNRFNVRLFVNANYRFDLNYTYLNFIPKIEAFIYRDWYAVVGGNYTFNQRRTDEFDYSNSNYYLEFSIKKYWGKTEKVKNVKQLRRLKVILYKDENGNNIRDQYEKGVPYVKTRLTLITPLSEEEAGHFPVDITLLSNEKGIVTFKQIPKGIYDLTLNSLNNLKEYFYVDKQNKSIDLSRTKTVYIPFQKANKIEGKIVMTLSQYSKERGEQKDLSNIKITAYNKLGNSYSSFTAKDGGFIIFAPGENTYQVRMKNVFGSNYSILQNDIPVYISDTCDTEVIFDVVENSRKISFKKARPNVPDSVKYVPVKVKVLPGEIYENKNDRTVSNDSVPGFNLNLPAATEIPMTKGMLYVVVKETGIKTDAVSWMRILKENGLKTSLGFDAEKEVYYVFTRTFNKRQEALKELKRIELLGIKDAEILKF
jgi:hypothetical protein